MLTCMYVHTDMCNPFIHAVMVTHTLADITCQIGNRNSHYKLILILKKWVEYFLSFSECY